MVSIKQGQKKVYLISSVKKKKKKKKKNFGQEKKNSKSGKGTFEISSTL